MLAIGKGPTWQERCASAFGELAERRHIRDSEPSIVASAAKLGSRILDPRILGVDLAGERPPGVVPFSPHLLVRWRKFVSPAGPELWVHLPKDSEVAFYRQTSNGCAVHVTPDLSYSSALAELIERDAFIRWWYGLGMLKPVVERSSSTPVRQALEEAGWAVRQHWLPALGAASVAMVSIWRYVHDVPVEVVIGLASAQSSQETQNEILFRALLEVIQALDTFALNRSNGGAPKGPLARYLQPEGAQFLAGLVNSSTHQHRSECDPVVGPHEAALNASIRVYRADDSMPETGLHFTRVVSPDTLPYPLEGKGSRLDHPLLNHASGTLNVGPICHPLG